MRSPGKMENILHYILLCICVLGLSQAAKSKVRPPKAPLPDEHRLLKQMFRQYDNSVRPVFNATSNVVVEFGLTLIQVMDMDEKNQVLVTNVWLEHQWLDERIKWDPDSYSGLKIIRIPASKLWLPDIVLYNNADDYTTGYMPSNAMVSHDGTVFWSPPARLRSSCKVDITFFPFDGQLCKMKFGSWTYDQAQVDITNKSTMVDMSNYVTNGEWELLSTDIMRNEVVYPISDAVYPDVTVSFHIYRRILYYILNIIFPCVWLNILSLLAFCLPCDSGEKITLGITVLLSYSVFMLLIAENMPPTSEFVPLIGIYLTISMAVTSISVILTVFVLKIHHGAPNQREVPRWIRFLVLKVLARLVGCQCLPTHKKRPRKAKPKLTKKEKTQQEQAEVCLRLVSDMNTFNHSDMDRRPSRHGHVTAHAHGGGVVSPEFIPDSRPDINAEPARSKTLDEILKYLKIMVAKRDDDDSETEVMNEWRHVAQVVDRFLFWLFLLTTLFSTLIIMVFIPLWRPRT